MALTPRAPDLASMIAALSARLERLERPAKPLVYVGSGAPSGIGASGDYYLRTDTPGTVNQRLYVNNAGVWTGIV